MITREMIKKGLENNIISIENEFNDCISLCCRIADNAFYFSSIEDENLTTEEYLKKYTTEEIVEQLYEVLKDFQSADYYGLSIEEWEYYKAILE